VLRSLVYRRSRSTSAARRNAARLDGKLITPGGCCAEVTDGCLQYWGGMGLHDRSEISRMYRDARLTSIGGGATSMLGIICKGMGILPGQRKNH